MSTRHVYAKLAQQISSGWMGQTGQLISSSESWLVDRKCNRHPFCLIRLATNIFIEWCQYGRWEGHRVSGITATKRELNNIGSCLNIQYMTSLLRSISRLQTASPHCHGISARFRCATAKSQAIFTYPAGGYELDLGSTCLMEPAHIPRHKDRQGWRLAGHLTVTLLPVGDLAAYRAKTAHDVLPDAIPIKYATTTKLPAKNTKARKWTLWTLWFNMYRKLFTIVTALNAVGIAFAASGHFSYAEKWTSAMALGNLNCAILMRNELFGRFLYLFVNTLFAKWTPLWWRLGCTSILQHLGGIHSGCALSGTGWLILKVVNNFRHHSVNREVILIVGVVTNAAVILSSMSAVPWLRNTHHNIFERLHRFIGWTALGLTWAFTILEDLYNTETKTWNLGVEHIIRQQDFCFAVGMTTFTIIPWLCVREVPVDIELPSSKVAVLRFERGMQQGLLGRISRTSIMEYHAFGTISEGTHAKYHYMVCGVQGDFTRGLVNNPPRTLWTRQLKFAGVSNTSTLYRRGVRICTGTGIGAALSTCLQSPDWFLIWIGSDQEKTFGPTINGLIKRNIGPERCLLWDSKREGGRPDTMRVLKKVYNCWGAEVVFITSNYDGNSQIMQGCKEAGIPAFGTLWDF